LPKTNSRFNCVDDIKHFILPVLIHCSVFCRTEQAGYNQ
jgi:hypothetical protein